MDTKTNEETFLAAAGNPEAQNLTPAAGAVAGVPATESAPVAGLKWDDLSDTTAIGIVAGELQWCIKLSIFEVGRFELWGYFGGRWCKWKDTFETVTVAKAHVATLSEGSGRISAVQPSTSKESASIPAGETAPPAPVAGNKGRWTLEWDDESDGILWLCYCGRRAFVVPESAGRNDEPDYLLHVERLMVVHMNLMDVRVGLIDRNMEGGK